MPREWTEDKNEQNPKSHLENRWGPGTRMLYPNETETGRLSKDLRDRESEQCRGNSNQWTPLLENESKAGPGRMGGFRFKFIICSAGSAGKSQRMTPFSTLKYPSSSMRVFVFKNTNTIEYSWWRVFDGKMVSQRICLVLHCHLLQNFLLLSSFFIRLELG